MAGRESEITVWLNNKLGSTDDFWSGISISSRLTKDRLMSAIQYFRSLQAHVKVKLLLAFLHVPRRLRDEWRDDLDLLYKVACTDGDLWVSMVAEVLRTFPESGDLNLDVKEDHRSYHDMVNDLKKMVRQQHSINMLPMESGYLNRTSLTSLYPVLPGQSKHFAIKRKPKSAALRVETLQKSTDAAKKNVSSFPVKMRSFAKKMDDDTPLKGLPNNTLTGSNLRSNSLLGRFSGLQGQKRELSNQKEGGIKLLDFDALPLSAKETRKRRKLELEQQKAAKKEEALAAATAAATSIATPPASSAMPDYAAGLLAVASFESLKSSQTSSEQSSVSASTSVTAPTAPSTSSVSLLSPNIVISSAGSLPTHQIRLTVLPVNTSTAQSLQQQQQQQQQQQRLQQQQFTPIIITQQNRPPMILTTPRLNQPSTILIQPATSSAAPTSLVLRPPGSLVDGSNPVRNLISTRIKTLQSPQHQILSPPPQQQQQQQLPTTANNNGISNVSAQADESQPKKELFLTREQVLKAQEMFTLYPGITRPEKALILGFMAGARAPPDNPCPNQGPVLNIRLGHTTESLPQPDGTFQPMVVDTYLQLNYSNGELKKLQKIRGKDGGEGD